MSNTSKRDECIVSDTSLRGAAESETDECCKISLEQPPPSLRRIGSTGTIPYYFAEASLKDRSELRRCTSSSLSLSRLSLLPVNEAFGDQVQEPVIIPPRACYSERISALELSPSNAAGIIEVSRKKSRKCYHSKCSLGRKKVMPECSVVEMEQHRDDQMSCENKRPKAMIGWEKPQHDRKSKTYFSEPNPTMRAAHTNAIQQNQTGFSGPLIPRNNVFLKDERFSDHLLTSKATKLERSLSRLYSTQLQDQPGMINGVQYAMPAVQNGMPAGRYFDALKGPEVDTLRNSEEPVLPADKKWPFLLRFPIGCFGICLGLGSQTILWKTLSSAASMRFLHVPKVINLMLWCLAVMALLTVFTTYFLKCVFYFEAVRREFYHPVRINFFFAPWIACMFLTLGVPPAVTRSIHPVLWLLFMTPIFVLELKVYGQWLSGGERRLCKVANPSTHLSLVGNFVGSLLAATVGWREVATFFWAVGLAHYIVLFVTLYQRLPSAAVLPEELHPVFFLFIAVPSTASVAWYKIVGDFDLVSRISYFVGLFLYMSLVVRVNFFRGFRFSVAWWAYTFPMTASAIATIHYSLTVKHPITQGLAVMLSFVSSVTVLSVFLFTILHTFLWRTMFPNDMAVAITTEGYRVKRKIKELENHCTPSESSPTARARLG